MNVVQGLRSIRWYCPVAKYDHYATASPEKIYLDKTEMVIYQKNPNLDSIDHSIEKYPDICRCQISWKPHDCLQPMNISISFENNTVQVLIIIFVNFPSKHGLDGCLDN